MKYSITTSPLVPVIMAITLIYQLNFIPLFIVGGFSIYCIYFYIILIQKEKKLSKGYTHKSISKYTPIQIIANQEETKIDSLYSKNRHKAQRKAKFYINKCRSASCMQSGLKQASA